MTARLAQIQKRTNAARYRRWRAARRLRPERIRLLLVAKAPPPPPKSGKPERYFYYPTVEEHDDLFMEIAQALLGKKPARHQKADVLRQLQKLGVFLIDMKLDPDDGTDLEAHSKMLVRRCRQLHPEHVVLISTPVYDAAYRALAAAGLPVVGERIDFPGSGRQKHFRRKFAMAMKAIGWPSDELGGAL